MNPSTKKYDLTQCALYKCRSKHRLAQLLQLSDGDLKHIHERIGYHSFEIEKKHSSEMRTITAPDASLKSVQKRILLLLQRVTRPEWLISSEKGKSYIDNGKAHLDAHFVLTIDIRKFYDNCSREPVYRFFRNTLKVEPDISEILTDIVTYQSGIPTGCPTSQIIAYYAYADMFSEIATISDSFGCRFSLYVDDMTFSSQQPFNPKALCWQVDQILRKYGHRPKYSKVKYYSADEYKPITGTVVTPHQTLAIPNGLQKKIYEDFQSVKKAVGGNVCSQEDAKHIQTLMGRIHAARMIQDGRFPEMVRITKQITLPKISSKANRRHRRSSSFYRHPTKSTPREREKIG